MTCRRLLLALAAGMVATGAAAADPETCTLPGELLGEDPAGDAGLQAGVDGLPGGQDDVLSLHAAEPASMPGKLVFTVTLSGLDPVPPGYRWVVYFNPPGQEAAGYWAAMTSTESPAPRFTYGTSSIVPTEDAPVPLRVFEEVGELDAASNYTPEGVITLVLDKSVIGSPAPGTELSGVLTTARRSAPDTLTGAGLTVDRAPGGEAFYLIRGTGDCKGKSGVEAVLGGSLPPAALVLLLLAALHRRVD